MIAALTAQDHEVASIHHHHLLCLLLLQSHLLLHNHLILPLEKTELEMLGLLRNNGEEITRFEAAQFQNRPDCAE